jgi:hypothetical protein
MSARIAAPVRCSIPQLPPLAGSTRSAIQNATRAGRGTES